MRNDRREYQRRRKADEPGATVPVHAQIDERAARASLTFLLVISRDYRPILHPAVMDSTHNAGFRYGLEMQVNKGASERYAVMDV